MVICLERGADCLHMVHLMPLHPTTPLSLASFKYRLVLPFWYRLSQVVLEKRPQNGCTGSSIVVFALTAAVYIITVFCCCCTFVIQIACDDRSSSVDIRHCIVIFF